MKKVYLGPRQYYNVEQVEEVELTGPTDLHVPGYKAKVTFGQLIKFAYPLSDSGSCISDLHFAFNYEKL